jgi:hypothetical protein
MNFSDPILKLGQVKHYRKGLQQSYIPKKVSAGTCRVKRTDKNEPGIAA